MEEGGRKINTKEFKLRWAWIEPGWTQIEIEIETVIGIVFERYKAASRRQFKSSNFNETDSIPFRNSTTIFNMSLLYVVY